jgi:hypothetical protein
MTNNENDELLRRFQARALIDSALSIAAAHREAVGLSMDALSIAAALEERACGRPLTARERDAHREAVGLSMDALSIAAILTRRTDRHHER